MKRVVAVTVVALAAVAAAALAAPHRTSPRRLAPAGSNGSSLSWDPIEVDVAQGVNDGPLMTGVYLTNTGSSDIHIGSASVTGAAWAFGGLSYACSGVPCTLPMGAMTIATVVFDPSAVQLYQGTLSIVSDTPQVTVGLNGSGTGVLLDLPADSLEIGSTPVGSTVTNTFFIRNTGNASQNTISLTFASASPQFAISNAPTIVPPSSSVPVTVTCTPDAIDTFHATVNIDAPGAITGSHLQVELTCAGIDGYLQVTPSPVDFGEVRIGVGATATVTLAEVGSAGALTLDEDPAFDLPAPAGITVGPPSQSTISVGSAATFDVTVSSDPGAAGGDRDGHITVRTHAGSGEAGEVGVDVKATLVTATFEVPSAIEAGTYCIGEQPRGTPVLLHASGTGAILVQSVAMASPTSPFTIANTQPVDYPNTIPHGASATIQLTPKLQTVPGAQMDDLVWTTDAAPGPSIGHTAVTATFVTDGGAISPQHIDFGSVSLGVLSATHDITLKNCGTDALVLQPLAIDRSGAFSDRSAFPLPAQLASSETATISVAFQPKKAGGATAVLTVMSSKGPLSVMLVGAGLGDPSDAPAKTSFYDCGCRSTPLSGAAPFALVIFATFRRRRAAVRRPR